METMPLKTIAGWMVALLMPASAAVGQVNRSWDVLVRSAPSVKKIVLTRLDSVKVEGKLVQIGADSITVESKGQLQVIQRRDVLRVRKAGVRRRHVLIAMGVGAGVGAAIGPSTERHFDKDTGNAQGAGEMGMLGLGVGALVGCLLPVGSPLYEREEPEKTASAQD